MILAVIFVLPADVQAATLDSAPGVVTTSGGRLNVRSSPSASSPVVASVSKGSYVTLMSKSGSWWRVEYGKGKYGYCHADYITAVAGTAVTVKTQASNLNVRSGAGTSYPRIATLGKGDTVIRLSTSGGWSKILFHGTRIGYVSSQYLSSRYGAVTLYVQNFKQTDARWAQTTIGESGKTFAQIGCATTAIAMVESHRTGTTIYPDAMSKQLRYTPSGSVYWPSHYTVDTNASGYLQGIYTRLQQGKPVLLGVHNGNGKQHWVVVYGYAGGESLHASDFLIRDPGTVSRTNLQQLLELYPHFYKYFYY